MQFLWNFAVNFTALAIIGYTVGALSVILYVALHKIFALFGYCKPDPDLRKFLTESLSLKFLREERGSLIGLGAAIIPFALVYAIKVLSVDPSENAITILFR